MIFIATFQLRPLSCDFQEEKSKGKVSDFKPNVLMLGLSASGYVLRALSSVHTNDLEQALLVSLSFCLFNVMFTLEMIYQFSSLRLRLYKI